MSLPESTPKLALNHGLGFAELFTPEGLQKIDVLFLERLRARDAKAHDTLIAWREGRATADARARPGVSFQEILRATPRAPAPGEARGIREFCRAGWLAGANAQAGGTGR